jgi:hypothetical protein
VPGLHPDSKNRNSLEAKYFKPYVNKESFLVNKKASDGINKKGNRRSYPLNFE